MCIVIIPHLAVQCVCASVQEKDIKWMKITITTIWAEI